MRVEEVVGGQGLCWWGDDWGVSWVADMDWGLCRDGKMEDLQRKKGWMMRKSE